MRNLIQPITREIGTIRKGGFDYHMQIISYGSQHQVYVFHKNAPHKRGLVFPTQQAYEQWKNSTTQLELPL